jgi:hypothetical protein
MTVAVALSLLAGGLAVLLARETKLRRALQALCSRLLARIAETTGRDPNQPTAGFPCRPRRR